MGVGVGAGESAAASPDTCCGSRFTLKELIKHDCSLSADVTHVHTSHASRLKTMDIHIKYTVLKLNVYYSYAVCSVCVCVEGGGGCARARAQLPI